MIEVAGSGETATTTRPGLRPGALPLLVAFLSVIGAFALRHIYSDDFWWYLASGRVVLDRRSIPEHDVLLAPLAGSGGWVKHSWLWTAVLAQLERFFGLLGPVVFGAVLGLMSATLVFTRSRIDRCGLANALGASALLCGVGDRFSLKADLISVFFFVILLWLVEVPSRRRVRRVISIVLLQWVWANFHGGFPLGIWAALAYSIGGWIESRGSSKTVAPLWLPPLLAAACWLTPHWFDDPGGYVRALVGNLASGDTGEGSLTIVEWMPTFSAHAQPAMRWLFIALSSLGLLSFLASRRPWNLSRLLLLVGMMALALAAVRFLSFLGVASAWVAIGNLGDSPSWLAPLRRLSIRPAARVVQVALAGVLVAILLGVAQDLWSLRNDYEVGQSASEPFVIHPRASCPGAADYVLLHDLQGPIFNDMYLGGYLEYRLYPRYLPFVDNRNLSYELLNEYAAAVCDPAAWDFLQRAHGFRVAILANLSPVVREEFFTLRQLLLQDPEWKLVYLDPQAVVFVRDQGRELPVVVSPFGPYGDSGRAPFLRPEAKEPAPWRRALSRLVLADDPHSLCYQYLIFLSRTGAQAALDAVAARARELRPDDAKLGRLIGAGQPAGGED